MSRWANKAVIPPLLAIWNPDSPRAVLFSKAMRERWGARPLTLPWIALLNGAEPPHLPAGAVVRIDSPGKNWMVEQALLRAGAAGMEAEPWVRIESDAIARLPDDVGRIHSSRQWFIGLRRQLELVRGMLESKGESVSWMLHPDDIAVMCDKAACQHRLRAAGVRIPPLIGVVSGFDELMSRMELTGRNRVFLKLCHGSSASGSVALERSAGRIQAFSSARMTPTNGGVILHNRRPVTRYTDPREIQRLVDAVCRHRALAEAWVPKAGWKGKRFDVRIVVIGGRSRHVVARLADGPFTNLQFGAKRGGAQELRDHIGGDAFETMCREAERAMACFPRSHHGGVDVLLEPGRYRPRILEVNAFGDLLPATLHEGLDTYACELEWLATAGEAAGSQVSATGT